VAGLLRYGRRERSRGCDHKIDSQDEKTVITDFISSSSEGRWGWGQCKADARREKRRPAARITVVRAVHYLDNVEVNIAVVRQGRERQSILRV